MMVDKAISSAQSGLLDAQARANRLARDIVRETGRLSSSTELAGLSKFTQSVNEGAAPNPFEAVTGDNADTQAGTGRPLSNPVGAALGDGDGSLINSIVNLKTAEQAFSANAKLLSTLDEMSGTVLNAFDTGEEA